MQLSPHWDSRKNPILQAEQLIYDRIQTLKARIAQQNNIEKVLGVNSIDFPFLLDASLRKCQSSREQIEFLSGVISHQAAPEFLYGRYRSHQQSFYDYLRANKTSITKQVNSSYTGNFLNEESQSLWNDFLKRSQARKCSKKIGKDSKLDRTNEHQASFNSASSYQSPQTKSHSRTSSELITGNPQREMYSPTFRNDKDGKFQGQSKPAYNRNKGYHQDTLSSQFKKGSTNSSFLKNSHLFDKKETNSFINEAQMRLKKNRKHEVSQRILKRIRLSPTAISNAAYWTDGTPIMQIQSRVKLQRRLQQGAIESVTKSPSKRLFYHK